MLIKREHLEGIRKQRISLAFRKWKKPTVKAGGTLRTAVGVLEIVSLDAIAEADITNREAKRAGFSSTNELLTELRKHREGTLYRVGLRFAGPDDRSLLREKRNLSAEEWRLLHDKLLRLDQRSSRGPWVKEFMNLVAAHPGVRAADLAALYGAEKDRFKENMRKLKELGLTESLVTGYRLSPRGRFVIALISNRSL